MAQPHKGDRRGIYFRLPVALAERIDRLKLHDRNAWLVGLIEAALGQEGTADHGDETTARETP